MYKLLFSFGLIVFFNISIVAQSQYEQCYFGTAAIDFSGGNPSALTNSQMTAAESAASMCSVYGELLFYTNGGNSPTVLGKQGAVWNANHQIMENGILGDSSGCISAYNGAIAFPSLWDTTRFSGTSTYYIFMRDCIESSGAHPYYNSGLTYCEIDMYANGGLGKVVSKNNTVVPYDPSNGHNTSLEPLTAISNGTNDGWFIFSYNVDSLYSIEINANGIGSYKSHLKGKGMIVFSPTKEHLMVGNKLYAFDVNNRNLSFITELPNNRYAFSPDGSLLYGVGSGLNQYDLTASNILGNKIIITSNTPAGNLFLAPDARIYLFNAFSNHLPGYINCPNSLGQSCDLQMNPIGLGGRESGNVFTNIPANYLYYSGSDCNLSVEKYKNLDTDFDIYPNPSNGVFNLELNHYNSPESYQVVSSDGRLILTGEIKSKNTTIDMRFAEAGIYFIHFAGHNKRVLVE